MPNSKTYSLSSCDHHSKLYLYRVSYLLLAEALNKNQIVLVLATKYLLVEAFNSFLELEVFNRYLYQNKSIEKCITWLM